MPAGWDEHYRLVERAGPVAGGQPCHDFLGLAASRPAADDDRFWHGSPANSRPGCLGQSTCVDTGIQGPAVGALR